MDGIALLIPVLWLAWSFSRIADAMEDIAEAVKEDDK